MEIFFYLTGLLKIYLYPLQLVKTGFKFLSHTYITYVTQIKILNICIQLQLISIGSCEFSIVTFKSKLFTFLNLNVEQFLMFLTQIITLFIVVVLQYFANIKDSVEN